MKLLIILLLMTSTRVLAAPKTWYTYPNSAYKRQTKNTQSTVNLNFELPLHSEKRKWRVSSTANGRSPTGTVKGAPAYSIHPLGGISFVGFVPDGTIINLGNVDTFGRSNYFSMPKPKNFIARNDNKRKNTSKNKDLAIVWIQGSYIEDAGPK